MRKLAALALGLALGIPPATAQPIDDRVPVALRLVGDDGLTQNLTASLEGGLRADSELRLAATGEDPALTIESDGNVDWDRLSGRTVIIYTVYLATRQARGDPVTGICYERDIATCVRDILRVARITADRL